MSGNPELPAETFRDLEAEIRFFFFSKPLPYVPREIQNKLCKRSLPALVDPQGPEQVLTLP